MKKTLFILIGCAAIATLVLAEVVQVKNTAAGYQIGTSVNQKIGFFGAAPVVRQTITNTAPVLVTLTLSTHTFTNAHADVTNVITAVTNVTVNAVSGMSSNQLQQIRNALVNLGLASTGGQ